MDTFADILKRSNYLNHGLVIDGKHTGERIVWTPDMRIAPIGEVYFRSFLNSEARVDTNECAIYSSFDYCPRMVREFLDSHQGKDIERAMAKELFYRVGGIGLCGCEVSAESALANCLNGDLRFFQFEKNIKNTRKCSCTTTLTGFSFASGASEVLLNSVFCIYCLLGLSMLARSHTRYLEPCPIEMVMGVSRGTVRMSTVERRALNLRSGLAVRMTFLCPSFSSFISK